MTSPASRSALFKSGRFTQPRSDCPDDSLVDGEEDEVCVVGGVAEGEDLVVDLLEGLLVDDARRAVLLERTVQPPHLPCKHIGRMDIRLLTWVTGDSGGLTPGLG